MLDEGIVLQNRYRVVRKLGGGGMGDVYLAYDVRLADKPCALKQLIPDPYMAPEERAQIAEQFHQEAAILAHLHHNNLPEVYDYFEEDQRFYLVMEYVQGETLAEQVLHASDGLPQEQVLACAYQLCDVLDYLHNQTPPVVFRDLKPGNVMLTADGTVKLIDFGIARLFDPSKKTDTLKMGTAGYAPPEQYAGQGQTSPLSDIYSLGVTLHELMTGDDPTVHPFVFTPPRRLRPDIPPHLSDTIMRAVSLAPEARFPSALIMKTALEETATSRKISWPLTKMPKKADTTPLLENTEPLTARLWSVARGALQGLWRVGGTVILVVVLVSIVLLIAGAFALSLFAEQAIANTDWDLSEDTKLDYVLTEDELAEGTRMAIEPYALDAVQDVWVDFRPPDQASLTLQFLDSSLSIHTRVRVQEGVPLLILERVNDVPLYVVGGIISNGIRRGFEEAWEDSTIQVSSLRALYTGLEVHLER